MTMMKLFLPVAFAFAVGCFTGLLFQQYLGVGWLLHKVGMPRQIPLNPHQQARIDLLRNLPLPNNAIVFLGDSLVDSYEWHESFPSRRVVVRAISGARSEDFAEIFDFERATALFVLVGANDAGFHVDPQKFERNYRRFLKSIPKRATVHLLSIPPIRKHGRRTVEPYHVIRLNQVLQTIAADSGHVFLDLHEALSKENSAFSEDGLHLSTLGYARFIELVAPKVNHLLAEPPE
jgi:hypothetical protein